MKYQVLVLNCDYTPHRIVSWKSAFVLIYSKDNGARLVASYKKTIKDSAHRTYNLPAVIVLQKYIKASNRKAKFSRQNIYIRDDFQCQYCGGKFDITKLNIDHVVARSKPHKLPNGYKMSSFENCVTACIQCNKKKGDKTLEQAKMRLLRIPKSITQSEKIYYEIVNRQFIPEEWLPYIERYE